MPLPKSLIKKYGVSKKAWAEYRKMKKGRKSSTARRTKRTPSKSTARKTYRRSTGAKTTMAATKRRRSYARKPKIMDQLLLVLAGMAGAVGGGAAANLIPIDNKGIKSAIPLAVGMVGTPMTQGALRMAMIGMSIAGGLSVAKTLTGGKVPLLAGEDQPITTRDVYKAAVTGQITPTEAAALVASPDMMGVPAEFAGVANFAGGDRTLNYGEFDQNNDWT